jgi:hypothetical protein
MLLFNIVRQIVGLTLTLCRADRLALGVPTDKFLWPGFIRTSSPEVEPSRGADGEFQDQVDGECKVIRVRPRPRPVWQGLSTNSLKFHPGPPCPSTRCGRATLKTALQPFLGFLLPPGPLMCYELAPAGSDRPQGVFRH